MRMIISHHFRNKNLKPHHYKNEPSNTSKGKTSKKMSLPPQAKEKVVKKNEPSTTSKEKVVKK